MWLMKTRWRSNRLGRCRCDWWHILWGLLILTPHLSRGITDFRFPSNRLSLENSSAEISFHLTTWKLWRRSPSANIALWRRSICSSTVRFDTSPDDVIRLPGDNVAKMLLSNPLLMLGSFWSKLVRIVLVVCCSRRLCPISKKAPKSLNCSETLNLQRKTFSYLNKAIVWKSKLPQTL